MALDARSRLGPDEPPPLDAFPPAMARVTGLLSEVYDGEMVEVDPASGTVRPLER